MMATWTTTVLPLHPLPVMPAMQARAGVGARAIAIAIRPGCLRWCRRCSCPWQWHQGHPLLPLSCFCCPRQPRCQCPLPSLPGRCTPPRQTCFGPPRRPSLMRAHQQQNLQVEKHPGPPQLRSGPLPLQLLSSWLPGCMGNATTLASLCRQVE
jgi:hypothetical protein